VCQCGAARCRGVIRSFAELPVELQQRYLHLRVVGEFAVAQPGLEPLASSA
jgi:hypothetical protein